MRYATKRLIDSVWTVAFTVGEDGHATIHGYSRECVLGYERETSLPRVALIEEGEYNRTVRRLVVSPLKSFRSHASVKDGGSREYAVVNPQFVFSYGEVPEPGPELYREFECCGAAHTVLPYCDPDTGIVCAEVCAACPECGDVHDF